MNKLSPEKRAQIITCLIEGNSIAATCRMTGAAKMTVLSLIREVGEACLRFHDAQVRYLSTVERVQCDEVWSFCYSKQKNVPEQFHGRTGFGSVWTWTALDADSKLMISWMVSDRNQEAADALIRDLKKRVFWRVQISPDGLPEYFNAILKTYRYGEADHGEIVKTYASSKPVQGTSPKSAALLAPFGPAMSRAVPQSCYNSRFKLDHYQTRCSVRISRGRPRVCMHTPTHAPRSTPHDAG